MSLHRRGDSRRHTTRYAITDGAWFQTVAVDDRGPRVSGRSSPVRLYGGSPLTFARCFDVAFLVVVKERLAT